VSTGSGNAPAMLVTIEIFYEDIKRRRMLGYGLPPAE
jgi:hypothetical protein